MNPTKHLLQLMFLSVSAILIAGLLPAAHAGQFREAAVFATNSVWMKKNAILKNGAVCVNDESPGPTLAGPGLELVIGDGVMTPDPMMLIETVAKANRIKVKTDAVVDGDVIYRDALINNGTITGIISDGLSLPLFATLPVFQAATPGTQDITVLKNESQDIAPGEYGVLKVKQGGTLRFVGGGVYNVQAIDFGPSTSLLFVVGSEPELIPFDIRVADKFSIDQNSFIGPDPNDLASEIIEADDVIFYVAGINGSSGNLGATPKAAKIGDNNQVAANFYVPNGTLWLKQNTVATGAFVARDVIVGIKVQVSLDSFFEITVEVTKEGTGTGTVVSAPAGIDCGSTCSGKFDLRNQEIALTAVPEAGSVFAGWSGDADCDDGVLTANGDKACTATFSTLSESGVVDVTLAGTGNGNVTSDPPGINCGMITVIDDDGNPLQVGSTVCSFGFPNLTRVTLSAKSAGGSFFVDFSGDTGCADAGSDGIEAIGDTTTSCTATFGQAMPAPQTFDVAVNKIGNGTVVSTPAGIDCGVACSNTFNQDDFVDGEPLLLTPIASGGSVFVGWSGNADCLDGKLDALLDNTCTARFEPAEAEVIVSVTGPGNVVSDPPGINCPAGACSFLFADKTQVTLNAKPGATASFVGFSGDPDCEQGQFVADAETQPPTNCTATFVALPAVDPTTGALLLATLTVNVQGMGSGTVISGPDGIVCSAGTCDTTFQVGTLVTLNLDVNPGSSFAGWSGAGCTGSSFVPPNEDDVGRGDPGAPALAPGKVILNTDITCTATFNEQ